MARRPLPPKIPHKDRLAILRASLLILQNEEEADHYLRSIYTPQEQPAIANRLLIFFFLYSGFHYEEIRHALGVASATITAGNRFRKDQSFVDPFIGKLLARLCDLGLPKSVEQLWSKDDK